MAFKSVVDKKASVWHLCDGAAWKPGFHLTLLAKSANAAKYDHSCTVLLAYTSNHNVMIINVQTPLHWEYILCLNAHCNGFMVNSQLHVTQFVPGCGIVCWRQLQLALSWDDFLRVVCVIWTPLHSYHSNHSIRRYHEMEFNWDRPSLPQSSNDMTTLLCSPRVHSKHTLAKHQSAVGGLVSMNRPHRYKQTFQSLRHSFSSGWNMCSNFNIWHDQTILNLLYLKAW